MYKIIDGKKIAQTIRAELCEKIAAFKKDKGRDIGLAVILVGENPASQIYVRNKIKACEEVGIKSFAHYLPEKRLKTTNEHKSLILAKPHYKSNYAST